jgi:hypothetical protein
VGPEDQYSQAATTQSSGEWQMDVSTLFALCSWPYASAIDSAVDIDGQRCVISNLILVRLVQRGRNEILTG